MTAMIVATVLLIVAVACAVLLVMRQRFAAHLDALEAEIRKAGSMHTARSDLPPEVVALASRMGAQAAGASGFVTFEQSGQMWQAPGDKPTDFTARQTVGIDVPAFLWRAGMGRPASVVADYFVAGTGGLEVMLLGAFPLARMIGGAAANQGEALRYLAEIPWNQDAILANSSLDWTVVDANTIKVATGQGPDRGEVTFELDTEGRVVRASAPARVYGAPIQSRRGGVRASGGAVGYSYALGRDKRKAEFAAVIDALLQDRAWRDRLRTSLIAPLAEHQR